MDLLSMLLCPFVAYLSVQSVILTSSDELVWLFFNYLSAVFTHETVFLLSFCAT